MHATIWHVTTEGDCEGRTTKDLGFHVGEVAAIASNLSRQSCYRLSFEEVKPMTHGSCYNRKDFKSVNISGFGEIPNHVPFNTPQDLEVIEGMYCHSVELVRTSDSLIRDAQDIENALSKLTSAERILLGV